MNVHRVLGLLLLVQACDDDLSAGPRLLAPAEITFAWDDAWNDDNDGVMALVPLDVMAYDGATGEPREGADLALRVSGGSLLAVDRVEAGEDGCVDCVWDTWSDVSVRILPGDDAGADEALGASGLTLRTDARGLARVYVVVDALSDELGVTVEARHPIEGPVAVARTRLSRR